MDNSIICMGPSVENIILGIIANGLYSVISYFGKSGKKIFIEKEIKKDEHGLKQILERGTNSICKELNKLNLDKNNKIILFLESPEVEMVVRQIYSAKLSNRQGIGGWLQSARNLLHCLLCLLVPIKRKLRN
jgi:hypothetical protein